MIKNYCQDSGLNAQMPFLWLSSHLLCKHSPEKYGRDLEHFLKTMQKLVKDSLLILKKYNGHSIPKNYLHIVDLLHRDYLEPIHRRSSGAPSGSGGNSNDQNDNYDMSYESYVNLKERAEEAREILGDSVKVLVSGSPYILDSDTIRVFRLEDDEMVKEIRSDFNI